jgi:WD40 repeat protein
MRPSRPWLPPFPILAALAVGLGCRTEESLVEVALTTAGPVSGLGSVTITASGATPAAGSVSQTFALASLSGLPTTFGVYVPSSLVGPVAVSAVARPASGCLGYKGSGSTTIDNVGETAQASAALLPADVCAQTNPPTLTSCTEYDHNDSSAAPCDRSVTPAVSNTYIMKVAFSPDGQTLLSSGEDNRVKVWRFDGSALTAEGHVLPNDAGAKLAFSPDGTLLAIASWGTAGASIAIWDVATWTLQRNLTGPLGYTIDVAFSPDGQHVIVLDSDNLGDGQLWSFSLNSGKGVSIDLGLPPILLAIPPITGPSGLDVAVSTVDGRVGLYTLSQTGFTSQGMILDVTSDASQAWAVAFSPDDTLLAAGGEDGSIGIWDVPVVSSTPDGAPLVVGMGNGVNMLAFSPDSAYLAVAAGTLGREASVWGVVTRGRLASYVPSYAPGSIAYAPGGSAIAGGELYCGKIFVCTD